MQNQLVSYMFEEMINPREAQTQMESYQLVLSIVVVVVGKGKLKATH